MNAKYEALFTENNHEVGIINTSWAKELANGAELTTANSDNYLLVELVGFNAEGVRTCKPLSDKTKKGLILSTVEEESLFGDGNEALQGNYTDFYNKVGEMCKLTIQESYLHFETSAYTLNSGVLALAKGLVAHYDTTTKKYILSTVGSEHADYSTAGNKYLVVDIDTDFGANIGKPTIRLECI